MKYRLNLKNFKPKSIYDLDSNFQGENKYGEKIGFTNYFMMKDGKPFFAVSGEFHFSRMKSERWEDELIKMKMAGINTVATYIFWIHHEEEEGKFRFDGRRDVRRFIELCKKHGLYVILRAGPFDHGEVRNGGYPDWLYGKPFDSRALSEGYLECVRKLYTQVALQVKGLFFKDGGPIIGVQIDNEYMHSAAPWERTTGISDEWVPGGHEGDEYMNALKKLAAECGLTPAFYTCTGWGGAATPKDMVPLWGGYAFRPWIFYSHKGEHPATDEYLYRDYHNNAVKETGDFKPSYEPETRPYSCCEMGGGMMCCYYYRFVYPYKSVDAMANIKIGSGCNFLGYYMFQGGSNPTGLNGLPMNEGQVPKISYDYQAALGEFGQERESYKRLKAMHYFATEFSDRLCTLKTVLPEGASELDPKDGKSLRYSVRTDGKKGFLFVNNYQDHFTLDEKKDEEIIIALDDGEVKFSFNIASDENAILPFNFDMDGVNLVSATAQPISRVEGNGKATWVFLAPDGMKPSFIFEEKASLEGIENIENLCVKPNAKADIKEFEVSFGEKKISVLVLNRNMANRMFLVNGGKLVFTEAALLEDADGSLRIESTENENLVQVYPKNQNLFAESKKITSDNELLDSYKFICRKVEPKAEVKKVGETRWVISLPEKLFDGVKDVLLQMNYRGDIGNLFLPNGMLVNDNFANGDVWEYGLSDARSELSSQGNSLTLYITPVRKGANVNVESAMAGRMEETNGTEASLESIALKPVYEIDL